MTNFVKKVMASLYELVIIQRERAHDLFSDQFKWSFTFVDIQVSSVAYVSVLRCHFRLRVTLTGQPTQRSRLRVSV